MLISFCNVCKMKYIKLNWISDGNLMFFGHAWKSIIFLAKSSETLDSNFCLQNGYKTGVLWKTILIHSRYNIKYVTIKSSAGEATVSDFDIEATNGVVHIVDHVFWFVMLLYHTSLFYRLYVVGNESVFSFNLADSSRLSCFVRPTLPARERKR